MNGVNKTKKITLYASALLGVGVMVAGCGSQTTAATSTNTNSTAKAKSTTTVSILIAGKPTAPNNEPLNKLAQQYEKLHPSVHIKFDVLGPSVSSISYLITKGNVKQAPDIVPGIQYNQATSGVIPKGLLVNLKPYFEKADSYAGGQKWINTFMSYAINYYMTSNGAIYSTPGSEEGTAIFYNKKDFATAGISAPPKTWAQWISDMKKLKSKNISPFLLGAGTACSTSWFERKAVSSLIQNQLSKIEVKPAQVLTGLDVAVGIQKGIISMKNPQYAEAWKLLASLKPYLYPGESTYGACASLNATKPPLSGMTPFIQNKVAMIWDGTWNVPTLNTVFKNKYGIFPFPKITKSTSKYASNLSFTGDVGGPNGTGIFSLTTPKANGGNAKEVSTAANFLEYITSPKNNGPFVATTFPGSVPVVKGANAGKLPAGMTSLRPSSKPPVAVDGILDNELDQTAGNAGQRLFQEFVSNNMKFSSFAKQWDAILQEGAKNWAKKNKVNLSKY